MNASTYATQENGVSRRRSLFIWTLFCVIAVITFLAYVFAGLAAGRGELLMPLDDAYIHFQYARQLAAGQLYVYNPGQPPSSGATSFLYPYLLAVGSIIGFQGLNLGLWAIAIGALALLAATWLVYRLSQQYGAPEWIAVLMAILFSLTGAVSWHFMSGMETGLVVFFTLLTLDALVRQSLRAVIAAASLLALIRPEGGILALLAVGALFLQFRAGTQCASHLHQRQRLSLSLPILAIGVQPLVNLLFTGSPVASGNAAKSLFGIVPPYPDVILSRIAENFLRTWWEFATSTSPREGLYLAYPIALLAFVGLIGLLRRRERRLIGLLILAWFLAGTLAVATLDTAFWHFKRYQMPLIALFFPLAAWGGAVLWPITASHRVKMTAAYALSGLTLALTLWTGAQFLHHYALNVFYIYLQPLQMARWLEVNTPPDSIVAVHDTGLIRYLGGRTTIDMVGLTTPGAAAYWRNGPGAVAEFLMQERPDYIASYGHGHGLGLGMLADTSLYGEPLASFPVVLDDRYNVALAADFQGIYRPDWRTTARSDAVSEFEVQVFYLAPSYGPQTLTGSINVGNVVSETGYHYRWGSSEPYFGFPTEVYEFEYVNCLVGFGGNCTVLDAGRRISREETFTVPVKPGLEVLLITRIHPIQRGRFDLYANDRLIGTRWIPDKSGYWIDVPTLIPADAVIDDQLDIRVVPDVPGGFYSPTYHWIYQGMYTPYQLPTRTQEITTFQNGAISLSASYGVRQYPTLVNGNYETYTDLVVQFQWNSDGLATGDYKVFIHLYSSPDEPPVAQIDERPGSDSMPPGNWLPGEFLDTTVIDLTSLSPGIYRLAVGLYDPVTLERLPPDTGGDADNRLFIGEVEIPPHG